MIEVTPQVNVKLVFPVGGIDCFSVPDDASHYSKNLIVGNAILTPDIIVAADDIVVGANLEDAVEDIFVAALVEDYIVTFTTSGGILAVNLDDVLSFTQKGHHAYPHIGVDKIPFF